MIEKKKKLKILVISNTYPLHKNDNTVIFLKTLYNEISKEHFVEIVAADNVAVNDKDNDNENLKIFRFKYWFRKSQKLAYGDAILSNLNTNIFIYFQIPFFILSMLFIIIKRIRKNKPDIIHAHWVLPCGFLGILCSKIFGIPIVVTSHGGDLYGLRGGIKDKFTKYVLRNAHVVNPVSKALKEVVSKDFKIYDSVIIPMGVNQKQFYFIEDAKMKINFSPRTKLILFVGRLSEKKGVSVLLEALYLMKIQQLLSEPYKLIIIGSGNMEASLIKKCNELDINSLVEFKGSIPNYKLKEYYSAADILTLPSISSVGGQEGLPVTLMEGLLCNCNIIATDSGGMKYLTNHDQITLIQQNNTEELAFAIKNNISRPKIFNSNLANSFKVENVAAKYIETYFNAIHNYV